MSPKVGDPVWVYDENRRVYQKNGIGSPIYREHWVLPVDSDFWRIKHHGDDATRRLDVMGVRLLEAVEAGMQEAPRG